MKYFLFLVFVSCTTTQNAPTNYQPHPMVVATASLFNQRTPSRLSKNSWIGDWVFRRDRLELVDKQLRNIKPDIMFFQEAIEKYESYAESDLNILGAGSLRDYQFTKFETQVLEETEEHEFLAFSVGLPLKVRPAQPNISYEWQLGTDGFLAATEIIDGDEPILLLNVQMPSSNDQIALWYSFIQERLQERLQSLHICPRRVIIAGKIQMDQEGKKFQEFMQKNQLKDSSAGFCQNAAKCFTATSTNELFMATVGDEAPIQVDRVLVHKAAIIYSSTRILFDAFDSKKYTKEYGLSRLWPSQRFGWSTSVRLPNCGAEAK